VTKELNHFDRITNHAQTNVFLVLGDSKCLWISMATMYENICGNCVSGVELTFV
jgi:hypothetical protein